MPKGFVDASEAFCRTCNTAFIKTHYRQKDCSKQCANKSAYHKNRRKTATLKYQLQKRYKLSLEAYNDLKVSQDNLCPVCLQIPEQYCVDHCHATNIVRGLLCRQCNLLLGLAKDDPERLERASLYLKKIKGVK